MQVKVAAKDSGLECPMGQGPFCLGSFDDIHTGLIIPVSVA
jgi:hypothetical protein